MFLCISAVDLQQEMSDVMKEAWDAESKLREIGEIIKKSDKRVQADGTLLKIRMCGNKCRGWRKADEGTLQ